MAFYDLSADDRKELTTALIARQAMMEREIYPPPEIQILTLMKRYSMTAAEMTAAIVGLDKKEPPP